MANHFVLFGRPLSADDTLSPMAITGNLPGYTSGTAYEGRLQVSGGVGRMRVAVLQSDLPPGTSVYVDNITREVVVKWPAEREVVEESSLLPNGSFEDGDDGSWSLGQGWSVVNNGNSSDGTRSAEFSQVKTKGSDLVHTLLPASLNDYIRVTADVKQGGSSKGNAGARVSLVYADASGSGIQTNQGNLVSSGKDGEWKVSTAEGGAPKGTNGVYVVISAYRNGENKPLWVDNVRWSHKYRVGYSGTKTFNLWVEVTDSLNRSAQWSGYFDDSPFDPYWSYVTTLLKFDQEALGVPPLVLHNSKDSGVDWDVPLFIAGIPQQAFIDSSGKFRQSLHFPGINEPRSVGSSDTQAKFGDGDFTFECYALARGLDSPYQNLINSRSTAGGLAGLSLRLSEGVLQAFNGGGSNNIIATVPFPVGVWNHVALARQGNVWRIFQNGQVVASGSVFGDVDSGGSPIVFLGGYGAVNFNAEGWVGSMDSIRLTKGFCRYTSNFTAPDRDFPER